MTGRFWPSALVAALFAVHPLRVESVAWVTERKDVLSGVFFMLTLGAYVKYVRQQRSRAWYLAMLAVCPGTDGKPMLVTLPLVLLLLDYWPLGRFAGTFPVPATPQQSPRHGNGGGTVAADFNVSPAAPGQLSFPWRLLVEKLPLLPLIIGSCGLTLWAQQTIVIPLERLPFWARVANALVSYVAYLTNFFLPWGLALYYPHLGIHLPIWNAVGAAGVLVAISVLVLRQKQRRYLLVGWLWFLGMLVPAIGLTQTAGQAMADRYTYLPEIGLVIALVWWAADVCSAWPYRRLGSAAASAAVLAALLAAPWHQTSFWCDSETLWRRTLDCTVDNKEAHNNLATALSAAGRLDEAIEHYRQSLYINPQDSDATNDLGVALARLNRFDEAVACYRRAKEIKPRRPVAYYNLGSLLADQGRFEEALPQLERAIVLKPTFAKAQRGLGIVLEARGRMGEAMEHFQRALETNPDDAESHRHLGDMLAGRGQLEEAMAQVLGRRWRSCPMTPRPIAISARHWPIVASWMRPSSSSSRRKKSTRTTPTCTAASPRPWPPAAASPRR